MQPARAVEFKQCSCELSCKGKPVFERWELGVRLNDVAQRHWRRRPLVQLRMTQLKYEAKTGAFEVVNIAQAGQSPQTFDLREFAKNTSQPIRAK
jgi:hypothetical protein